MHLEEVRLGKPRTAITLSENPHVYGESFIYVGGGPPNARSVEYFAHTMCTYCNSNQFPEGDMSIRQFTAGGQQTLDVARSYTGFNNAYGSGSYYTTVSGDYQSGYLNTLHYVDVWGPWNPEYRSSASGQV
jgi:hypothetical protein